MAEYRTGRRSRLVFSVFGAGYFSDGIQGFSMKATVLVPAAGMGRRMGASINKQYLNLAGKPILAHTLALFEQHPQIEHIYPIVPREEISYCQQQIIDRYGFTKVRRIVSGGAERQDSVRHGLQALADDDLAQPDRIVLIHDGVRPLFNPLLLPELITIIAKLGACVVGVPVKDTIKEVAGGLVCTTPERQRLWQAQTPQGFRYQLLAAAFQQAAAEQFLGTDDASLLERSGQPVAMLRGDYRNIKVTTPEDLVVAAAFLDMQQEESA
jgi:2-C-methyl-D-erythritol 4-phosphate cytidylyltransferase